MEIAEGDKREEPEKVILGDTHAGPVVKNLPASEEDRFDPCSGKIPHAAEQLSPHTATPEPACPRQHSTARVCASVVLTLPEPARPRQRSTARVCASVVLSLLSPRVLGSAP